LGIGLLLATGTGFTVGGGDGAERHLPFDVLAKLAEARAGELQGLGVKKGDRVGIVLADSDEFILTFVAAMTAGAVPVPIYPPFSFKNLEGYLDSVAHILRASRASLLVTTAALEQSLAPALQLRGVESRVVSTVVLEQHRQGVITRQLAAWAAILAVPTAIAGIYGMNFDYLPELHWRWGYPMVWVLIITICGGLLWRFRRIGWI
jgi:acyl-CoA synthetase (AMP-forming)/AMP-acid ligase II